MALAPSLLAAQMSQWGRPKPPLITPLCLALMDEFARYGFDVWTMDHEGYGRSTRTDSNSDILSGVEDLRAAMPVIEKVTGHRSVMKFGQSSGAIRAGAFANCEPERVERLVLDAFTYTGENAPEIMRRRARVETFRASPHRRIDRSTFTGIFSRDDPSTLEPARRSRVLSGAATLFIGMLPAGPRHQTGSPRPRSTQRPADCKSSSVRRAGYGYSGTPAFRPAAIAPAAA